MKSSRCALKLDCLEFRREISPSKCFQVDIVVSSAAGVRRLLVKRNFHRRGGGNGLAHTYRNLACKSTSAARFPPSVEKHRCGDSEERPPNPKLSPSGNYPRDYTACAGIATVGSTGSVSGAAHGISITPTVYYCHRRTAGRNALMIRCVPSRPCMFHFFPVSRAFFKRHGGRRGRGGDAPCSLISTLFSDISFRFPVRRRGRVITFSSALVAN